MIYLVTIWLWLIISIWAFFFELDCIENLFARTLLSVLSPLIATLMGFFLFCIFAACKLFGYQYEDPSDIL